MIGIDNSPAMLDIANEKREQNHSSSLYLCQDMREFELYGTVAAIVSLCDSVNYITEPEDRDDISFIWDNYYDEEEAINELALSLFVKEPSDSDADDNLFRKYEELHVQKGYTLKQMKQMVADSGLTLLAAYDAFTHEPADEECERIYIIAKETRNKNSKKQYIQ